MSQNDISLSMKSLKSTKYFLILLLILGVGGLIYWLIKKYKNKKVEVIEELKSPIERATILLKNLEKKEKIGLFNLFHKPLFGIF